MARRNSPLDYPVTISPALGTMNVKITDLGLAVGMDLPKNGQITSQWLAKLAFTIGKVYLMAERELSKKAIARIPAPLPSRTKMTFDFTKKQKDRGLTSKEFCDAIHGRFSERTIRRMADRGEIKAFKTKSGHRRFPEAEVNRVRKELGLA